MDGGKVEFTMKSFSIILTMEKCRALPKRLLQSKFCLTFNLLTVFQVALCDARSSNKFKLNDDNNTGLVLWGLHLWWVAPKYTII